MTTHWIQVSADINAVPVFNHPSWMINNRRPSLEVCSMDVSTLFNMITNLIAAARAGDWRQALAIAIDIIKALPTPTHAMASPAKATAFAAIAGHSEDELLAQLEALKTSSGSDINQLADAVMPLLVALLKKWLIG